MAGFLHPAVHILKFVTDKSFQVTITFYILEDQTKSAHPDEKTANDQDVCYVSMYYICVYCFLV